MKHDHKDHHFGSYPSAITLAHILEKPGAKHKRRGVSSLLSGYSTNINLLMKSNIADAKLKGKLLTLLYKDRRIAMKMVAAGDREVEEFGLCVVRARFADAIRSLDMQQV